MRPNLTVTSPVLRAAASLIILAGTVPIHAQPTPHGLIPANSPAKLTDTRHFHILDDPALTSACLKARQLFLDTEPQWQPGRSNRLDFTLLILHPDGTVLRGGHGQDTIAYPASCVKLPFMAAAMRWARENNLPPDALHSAVGPMITVSSNITTGETVDAITGAPNIDDLTTATDFRFRSWMDKRRYTERFLESRGLLGNQTILHKTYPSNSGSRPAGAEGVASQLFGGNRMQPRLSASLMLEIATGVLEPQAHAYMMQQLLHDRFSDDSVVGWGLPPGTVFHNKPGVAYDTAEDIAYALLPNGRRIILAAYSNSWERNQPLPHDANRLGRFTEILLAQTGLDDGIPSIYSIASAPNAALLAAQPTTITAGLTIANGAITTATITATTRTLSTTVPILVSDGTTDTLATWTLSLPSAGHYELTAFHPAAQDLTTSAVLTIHHTDGTTTVALNQRIGERRPKPLGTYHFGPQPWKSPAPAPTATPVQARITLSAPIGQTAAADAIRAVRALKQP
jgi:protein phosphatase methylesterase 1